MRRRKQECREAGGQQDHQLGFSLLEMLVVLVEELEVLPQQLPVITQVELVIPLL